MLSEYPNGSELAATNGFDGAAWANGFSIAAVTGGYGGSASAPIAAKIMTRYFNIADHLHPIEVLCMQGAVVLLFGRVSWRFYSRIDSASSL